MKGWVIFSEEQLTHTPVQAMEGIKRRFNMHGQDVETLSIEDISFDINSTLFRVRGIDVERPKFVLFRTNKVENLALVCNHLGIRTFNSFSGIQNCKNKLRTHLLLSNRNIPMPNTELMSKKIDELSDEDVVIKNIYGSCGIGVWYKNVDATQLRNPYLKQEFIKSSYGKDIRVHVIGHKVFKAYERCNDNDFRSNISCGGSAKIVDLDSNTIELCEKASKILDLDICGIDLLYGENDTMLLCEVNAFPGIKGLEIKMRTEYLSRIITYVCVTMGLDKIDKFKS